MMVLMVFFQLIGITKEKKYIFVKSMVTKKTEIMTTQTTQTLENQLITLKNNMKFAQHFEVVCQGQIKKESFSFTSLACSEVKLFDEKIFSFSGLSFTINDVKHFEEVFEICFDKKIYNEKWIQVIKSMKYVLKHINSDDNDEIAYKIANEYFNK
jgi:hypothetical protein